MALEAQDVPATNEGHEDASKQSERDEPDEALLHGLKSQSESKIFVGEALAIDGGDLLGNLEEVRTPRQKIFSDELLGVLLAIAGTPAQNRGDGVFLVGEKALHFGEQELLFRKLVGRETLQRGAHLGELFCDVAGRWAGCGKLILQEKTF